MSTTFVNVNNVNTTLADPITSSGQTSITLTSAANLPTLSAGQVMPLTLNDAATQQVFEIVYVTAITGATLTVVRGQEGTSATTWLAADKAYSTVTAAELATFAQAAVGVAPATPCCRPTLVSGSPIMTSNQLNLGVVYITPTGGSLVYVYNGSAWVPFALTEIAITLTSAQNVSGKVYDLFLAVSSGALVAGTGPAWTDLTGRSAAITNTVGGLWTNSSGITIYNNNVSHAISANQALYVGSIYCNGTAQVSFLPIVNNSSSILGIFSAYNQVPIDAAVNPGLSQYTANSWTTGGVPMYWIDGLGLSYISADAAAVIDVGFGGPWTMTASYGWSLDANGPPNVGTTVNAGFASAAGGFNFDASSSVPLGMPSPIGFHYLQFMFKTNDTTSGSATYSSVNSYLRTRIAI